MTSERLTKEGDILILCEDEVSSSDLVNKCQTDEGGAISTFMGTTRNNFEGKTVISLEYEAYEDMALDAIERICEQIRSQWNVLRIVVAHKLGPCPVGEVSIFIGVSSVHRFEAIKAVEFCINEFKATVPIWKKEVYGGLHNCIWKQNKEFVPRVPLGVLGEVSSSPVTSVKHE